MSGLWRAFYGAAVGALLVLFLHPASRPYLLTSIRHWGSSHTFLNTDLLLSNHPVLPPPDDPLKASLWMEAGAQRLALKEPIHKADLDKLIVLGRTAASGDPDNAYWRQMLALFIYSEGDIPNARTEWMRGARCGSWNDYQTKRLKLLQQQLAKESEVSASWQFAAVYPVRSLVQAAQIKALAEQLVKHADLNTKDSLLMRYATVINGQLLRLGARSVAMGDIGASIVEVGSYPPELRPSSPRKLILARTELYNRLDRAGLTDEAAKVDRAFKLNDGWMALTNRDEVNNHAREVRAVSLATITLPSALLGASIFGSLLWAFSYLLRVKPAFLALVEPPLAPALGIVLAAILYGVTRLPLASIAVASCFGFLAFTPVHERSKPPDRLGPVYELALFALGLALVSLFCAFVIGVSTPGCQLLSSLSVPREFFGGSTLFLGLCGIVLGLLLLAAPCWAMIQRIATPAVLVQTFRVFGRGVFHWCLTLAIILTPASMLIDSYLRNEVQQMALNEPWYYVNQ